MAKHRSSDTMPKLGHVTDLRTQWLVKTDGALAHHLQDREISSHLCENRCRNQQIRQDFPVALSEQQCIQNEAYKKELIRRRQAEIDSEMAREMAEINLRQERRNRAAMAYDHPQPHTSRYDPALDHFNFPPNEPLRELKPKPNNSLILDGIDIEALGLTESEILDMKKRLEQEEIDARLARQLNEEVGEADLLMADMRCAVEAQDNELARLLQEREYRKLQRAKEKARQKALLKKQLRLANQQGVSETLAEAQVASEPNRAQLLDAYSNPKDMIRDQKANNWVSKSVESDLNYVEPFEKEHIQSKANALHSKEVSRQMYPQMISGPGPSSSQAAENIVDMPKVSRAHPQSRHSYAGSENNYSAIAEKVQKQPPPLPTSKKPKFPEPSSIRPAAHYSSDNIVALNDNAPSLWRDGHSSCNSTIQSSSSFTSPQSSLLHSQNGDKVDGSNNLSVGLPGIGTDSNKRVKDSKKRKGCKIQ